MHSEDAKERFYTADAYYRRGRFAEALFLLDELNSAFPGTPNILYPRARCMHHLGRGQEAIQICDVLVKQFKHKRAAKLRKRIVKHLAKPKHEPESEPGESLWANVSLDDILGPPPPPPPPPTPTEKKAPAWLTFPVVAIMAAIAAAALIIGLAL